MKKRVLSLILALVAVLSLSAPAMAEPAPAPAETAAPMEPVETSGPTSEPTEAPMETEVPTLEPTETPIETPLPTSEPMMEPIETVVPTLEPTEAPEETSVPTLEPTEVPTETSVPTTEPTAGLGQSPEPSATPDPDGIMPIAEAPAEGTLTLNMTEVTFKSDRRPVTLKLKMDPYGYDWNDIKWVSSDENVVTVTNLNDPTAAADGQAKLSVKGPGTATITATAVNTPTKWTATCTVTVSRESTTWGKSLSDVKAMGIDAASKLSVYDGRDLGIMSALNNQRGNICVAEGHTAAMETSLLYQGILSSVDLDSHHLAYNYTNHSGDPLHNTDQDSDHYDSITSVPTYQLSAFLTQWNGPVTYRGEGNDKADGYAGCVAKPEDIVFATDNADRDMIKRLIVQYGAVACEYPTPGTNSPYHKWFKVDTTATHASAIVGWDDTVEPGNFPINPGYEDQMRVTSPGAWIIKNSWGPVHGDGQGYFYLSYEAPVIRPIAYKMMAANTYDFNYFYDGSTRAINTVDPEGEGLFAASFEAKKGGTDGQEEYLEAVNVGTRAGCSVTVEVYTNVDPDKLTSDTPDPTWGCLEPAATVEKSFPYRGFYTIRLPSPIKLEKGQYFTVVVKPSVGGLASSRESSTNDLTFMTSANGGWRNTRNNKFSETLRLKAYTKLHPAGTIPAPSATPVPSPSPTPEPTATPEPTPEPTATPEPTPTPTATPEPTDTPVPATPTPTATVTPTDTPVPSTPTPTATVKPTDTPEPVTPTDTPVPATPTPTATVTPTDTPVPATPTPTATVKPTDTPEPVTPTDTPVPATPTPTATVTPTDTPVPATPTPTATVKPTDTPEPVTPTDTPEPAETATPTPATTATAEPTSTATPEPVQTATPEPTVTATPAGPATSVPFVTPMPTPTPTPVAQQVTVQAASAPGAPAASIAGTDTTALAAAVLTDSEKELVRQGQPVIITLQVANADASETEQAAITSCLSANAPGYMVGAYLDVSLLKQIGSSTPEYLTGTGIATVTITVDVPEAIRALGRSYVLVRLHDGQTDVLADLDSDPNTITFRTDRFSLYAIAYGAEQAATATPIPTAMVTPQPVGSPTAVPTASPAAPTAPGTGDDTPLALYGTMLMFCVAGLVLVRGKKRRHE